MLVCLKKFSFLSFALEKNEIDKRKLLNDASNSRSEDRIDQIKRNIINKMQQQTRKILRHTHELKKAVMTVEKETQVNQILIKLYILLCYFYEINNYLFFNLYILIL